MMLSAESFVVAYCGNNDTVNLPLVNMQWCIEVMNCYYAHNQMQKMQLQ